MHTVGECFQSVRGIFHGHTCWAFEYPAHGHHYLEGLWDCTCIVGLPYLLDQKPRLLIVSFLQRKEATVRERPLFE